MPIVTFKNGAKAEVVEVQGRYKDTKTNRLLNRVGDTYTKKMYRIVKGGKPPKQHKGRGGVMPGYIMDRKVVGSTGDAPLLKAIREVSQNPDKYRDMMKRQLYY